MTTSTGNDPGDGLCPFAPLAGPFADGELAPREARAFLRHLFACRACREELRAVSRLSELLRGEASPGHWYDLPEAAPAKRPTASRAPRPVAETAPKPTLAGEPALGGAGHGSV